ncbi:MAG TPA: YraN family protein [Casimicrobiaceae bacterium]|nr:YraN family protein [Casimicrobiaceae bacterium]
MPVDASGGKPPRAVAGARAERLAAEFLAARGLAIIERNFRTRRGEIDLIARDGETLVFVEVRFRRNADYGGAAASITHAKGRRLIAAANVYLARLGHEPPCRFDAVLLDGLDAAHITWERDILSA